jgi:hypothetical protein
MATTTAISPVSRLGVLLAGLLLGGPAWPASRVTTQPYRGADVLRGLDTPPTVTEIRHLDPTTGYLKVSVLTMPTPGEVARALIQLGGVERLSLDLRGNGGGRLDAARDVAELFMPPDHTFSSSCVDGHQGGAAHEWGQRRGAADDGPPMEVRRVVG